MRYEPISKDLFIHNRKNFMAQMKPNSVAVFNSNDIYPIGADSTMPFQQDRNIYYLSGVDQEESILLLFPDAPKAKHREILFLKETNAHIAVWEGEKLTEEKAFETSGIKTVYWLKDFQKIFQEIMTQSEMIYINTTKRELEQKPTFIGVKKKRK
jgi:Xaa-Pro aminopeptidase